MSLVDRIFDNLVIFGARGDFSDGQHIKTFGAQCTDGGKVTAFIRQEAQHGCARADYAISS